MYTLWSLLLISISLVVPAHAGEEAAKGTRSSLAVSVSEDVPNDEVVVTYRVDAKGSDAHQLQRQVNDTAARITARLSNEKVRHTTTGRSMSPVWSDGFFSTRSWELSQSGRVQTRDIDAVADWLADIEAAGAKLNGLLFQVSEEQRRVIEARLRMLAIQSFRAQAADVAKGLAAGTYRILNLETNTGGDFRPMARREVYLAKSASSEPSLAAGESHITVSVSGHIETPFRDFSVK